MICSSRTSSRFIFVLVIALLLLVTASCGPQADTPAMADPRPSPGNGSSDPPEPPPLPTYSVVVRDGALMLGFDVFQAIAEDNGWTVHWHPVDRVLRVDKDERFLELVGGIPVVQRNGEFLPLDVAVSVDNDGNIFVPAAVLSDALGWDVEIVSDEGSGTQEETESISVDATKTATWQFPSELPDKPGGIAEYLGFLAPPISGAHAGFLDSQVPGAPRDYRNGTHEGFDWYGYAIGVRLERDTPVHAMADGVVVRADHGWQTPTREERAGWLREAKQAPSTPVWILDLLRGRQVWIMHDHGVMVRYAHLSSIPDDLQVGQRVKSGQVVGHVGNSGTNAEVEGTDEGLHLHSDILVFGENIWTAFPPATIRSMMDQILATASS